jgi:hypothetical protein
MNDGRSRTEAGPLALARRLIGRVLDTVRGAEGPAELVPVAGPKRTADTDAHDADTRAREPDAAPHAERVSPTTTPEARGDEAPALAAPPAPPDEPARALLTDASWSGLRLEQRGEHALLAWRGVDLSVDLLRTVEVRCDYGALDASPEVRIHDRAVSATSGAATVASDAHRVLVALGTMRGGEFVSVAHASVR